MPTIINVNGFRIIIWPADHEPPHVHIFKGKGEAKIAIGKGDEMPRLITIHDLTKQEIRQAWGLVAENQKVLLTAWRNIHGNFDN
jgi:hypothetical protein